MSEQQTTATPPEQPRPTQSSPVDVEAVRAALNSYETGLRQTTGRLRELRSRHSEQ